MRERKTEQDKEKKSNRKDRGWKRERERER